MKKLKIGIISPANNVLSLFPKRNMTGIENFEKENVELVFSKNAIRTNDYTKNSVEERINEINEILDEDIDLIMATIGGYTSIQLLDKIDYNKIIKKNVSICGFSDITAILLAIYTKTKREMLYGPVYTVNLCDYGGIDDYTKLYLFDCIAGKSISYVPSKYEIKEFIDWNELEKKKIIKKKSEKLNDWKIICKGMAKGKLIGGNLSTILLILGSEYLPLDEFNDSILFLEDCNTNIYEFCSYIDSLRIRGVLQKVKGILFGKFDSLEMNDEIEKFLTGYFEEYNIPIVCNMDFGHVFPIMTLPIGRNALLKCSNNKIVFEIEERK